MVKAEEIVGSLVEVYCPQYIRIYIKVKTLRCRLSLRRGDFHYACTQLWKNVNLLQTELSFRMNPLLSKDLTAGGTMESPKLGKWAKYMLANLIILIGAYIQLDELELSFMVAQMIEYILKTFVDDINLYYHNMIHFVNFFYRSYSQMFDENQQVKVVLLKFLKENDEDTLFCFKNVGTEEKLKEQAMMAQQTSGYIPPKTQNILQMNKIVNEVYQTEDSVDFKSKKSAKSRIKIKGNLSLCTTAITGGAGDANLSRTQNLNNSLYFKIGKKPGKSPMRRVGSLILREASSGKASRVKRGGIGRKRKLSRKKSITQRVGRSFKRQNSKVSREGSYKKSTKNRVRYHSSRKQRTLQHIIVEKDVDRDRNS